jgi:hypothetical protein
MHADQYMYPSSVHCFNQIIIQLDCTVAGTWCKAIASAAALVLGATVSAECIIQSAAYMLHVIIEATEYTCVSLYVAVCAGAIINVACEDLIQPGDDVRYSIVICVNTH